MPGWLGSDGPYWFSQEEEDDTKYIWASIEPGGLQIAGNMEDEEWNAWIGKFTSAASAALGYPVGCVWDGFGYE
ncbi:hypothetical protein [Chitinophaga barathri]|uniref:hypothetical protein n=1 Tax=Chitinophaga barathri TaxID=1647451 RepID=UPI0019D4C8EC|nr:hypothetical protein [Chitinophaga barathri]